MPLTTIFTPMIQEFTPMDSINFGTGPGTGDKLPDALKKLQDGINAGLPGPKGDKGDQGLQGLPGTTTNTYTSYTALQASDPARKTAFLVGDIDANPHPDGTYTNPTGTSGGWVSQKTDGIAFLTAPGLLAQLSAKTREWVSLSADFGVVAGFSLDQTDKVQAAFNFAISTSKHLLLDVPCRVSHIDVNNANGLVVFQKALIIGLESGSYDSVLTLRNSSDVDWHGRLWISGAFNPGYTCAVAIYTDIAVGQPNRQASNINIYNPVIVGTRLAMRFSRAQDVHPLVSEISVFGGHTYGCPSVVEAWGTQTVVSFQGSKLISNALGAPSNISSAWSALPAYTVRVFAADIRVLGGEVQHNNDSNGATFCVEPIADADYGNVFGKITVVGAQVETAARLLLAQNSRGVIPVTGSGLFAISHCGGYHSQDAFPFLDMASDFSGRIEVASTNDFYCGVNRTKSTVVSNGPATINVASGAFGKGFIQGLAGINGGVVKFSFRELLRARSFNNALIANTPQTLRAQGLVQTEDTSRFGGLYSSSTGKFTVPLGGLRNVVLDFSIRTDAPSAVLGFDIYIGENYVTSFPNYMGGPGNNGVGGGRIALGDLDGGQTLEIRATSSSNANCNGGTYLDRFSVWGAR